MGGMEADASPGVAAAPEALGLPLIAVVNNAGISAVGDVLKATGAELDRATAGEVDGEAVAASTAASSADSPRPLVTSPTETPATGAGSATPARMQALVVQSNLALLVCFDCLRL